MGEIFYLNGKLVPHERAKVSLVDYGFLYGYSLYETVRAYGEKPFRLDNHLARLRFSGEKLGILIHTALIRDAVNEVIKANGFPQTRVRITVSAGEGSMTPNVASCEQPTIAVLAAEYTPPPLEKYTQGYKAIVSSIRRNSQSPVTYLKTGNAIENMLARQEAKKAGADEALFLNEKGNVSEASASNVFLVSNGILKTPRYESGILPGVTRVVVFEIAAQLGIRVKEVNIKLVDLLNADEAFLTNSLIEIVPLTSVGEGKIGGGVRGTMTCRLMEAYWEMLRKEVAFP